MNWGPKNYIGAGLALGFIGGILIAIGTGSSSAGVEWLVGLGVCVAVIGQVFLLIGVIAKGVEVGMRSAAAPAESASSEPAAARGGGGAWYLDKDNPDVQRWWDGTRWTDRTRPAPWASKS